MRRPFTYLGVTRLQRYICKIRNSLVLPAAILVLIISEIAASSQGLEGGARDWPVFAGLLKGHCARLSLLFGANCLIRSANGLTVATGWIYDARVRATAAKLYPYGGWRHRACRSRVRMQGANSD